MDNVKKIFWILLGNFVLILGQIFVPFVQEILKGTFLFLFPFLTFFLLGIFLTILVKKGKIKGRLRKMLLLTGISSSGVFIGVLLHNFLYALTTITQHISLLSKLLEILHVIFFIFATIACPIGFIIGIVGSLLLFNKKKKL